MYGTYPYILALNLSSSDVLHMPSCFLTVNELQEYVIKQAKFKKEVELLKKPLDVGFKAVTGNSLLHFMNNFYQFPSNLSFRTRT